MLVVGNFFFFLILSLSLARSRIQVSLSRLIILLTQKKSRAKQSKLENDRDSDSDVDTQPKKFNQFCVYYYLASVNTLDLSFSSLRVKLSAIILGNAVNILEGLGGWD